MKRVLRAAIAGLGHYLPGEPVDNEELIARHGIRIRRSFVRDQVGSLTRHFAAPGQCTSDLAVEAAARAIESSGVRRQDLRRVILATVSGDFPTPATACVVQHKLGLTDCAAIDVVGACSGFLQALDLGARSVTTGEGPVLVIGADIRSRQLNFGDARTAFLYGDGAGAAVLTECRGNEGIWHSILVADGAGAEAVCIPAGGSREPIDAGSLSARRDKITMPDGRLVAESARAGFRRLHDRLLAETGVAAHDIGFYCLHQPNLYLVRRLLDDIGVPESRAWINFPRFGNTTSATVPIVMSEAQQAGRLVPGTWVCLGAVGAGFAGAIQLVKWSAPCT